MTRDQRSGLERRQASIAKARAARWKGSTPESRRAELKAVTDARLAGRERKPKPEPVLVLLPMDVYDRYCRVALRAKIPLRSVLRDLLILHAPS
jgi:hypothetical protein